METSTQTQNETQRRDRAPEVKRETREAWVAPAVDVLESEADLLVLADVPGVVADDVTVEIDKGVLTFVARAPSGLPRGRYAYRRSFAVPRDFDGEAITAKLDGGVLELRIPRRASAKRKQIEVRSA